MEREKEKEALSQLVKCGKAECYQCSMNVEEWKQCEQVIKTCERILKEALGIHEQAAGE